jgi:hypothetical protein
VDNRFLRAFRDPSSRTILGKRVFPFCLKHRVRLLSIESPLVTTTEHGITPTDLLIAVKVCAEESDLRVGFWDEVRLRIYHYHPERFSAEVARFVEHCHLGAWPKYWESSKTSDSADGVGIPWPLMIVTNLVANGIEEQRAWEMPETQAIWLSTAFSVRGGAKVNLLTTEEEEFMETVRRGELPAQQS